MKYALGNMLNGAGGLNPDGLSLDLQFAADKTLTARKGPTPVFTRGSGATQVGSTGLIEYAPENLILRSQESSFWGVTGSASKISTDSAVAPDGTMTADVVGFSGASGYLTSTVTSVASPVSATISCWVRVASETALFRLQIVDAPSPNFTATTTWQRFSHTGSLTSSYSGIRAASDGSSSTLEVWGLQVERSSTARTYIPTTTAAVYGARFDHDPVTLACKGLLIEESRTNLVFPSDTLTTQTRTVTAVAHTLSFYGAGTVVLSGAAIATVTGTGAYPTRTTLTFTPTAGSLTLTVTGSVTQAQLEAGSFATSYIPTTTASVIRSADVCSITAGDFSGFYNQAAGTMVAVASANGFTTTNNAIYGVESGTTIVTRVFHRAAQTNRLSSQVSATVLTPAANYNSTNVVYKTALAADINGADYVIDGTQITDAYTGSVLTADNLKFTGMSGSTSNTTISSFRFYKKRLSVAKLQTLTV